MDAPFLNVVVRADSFPLFRAMFVHCGACHSVADDRELNVLMTVSSTMGPFYYTLAAIRDFVTSKERRRGETSWFWAWGAHKLFKLCRSSSYLDEMLRHWFKHMLAERPLAFIPTRTHG